MLGVFCGLAGVLFAVRTQGFGWNCSCLYLVWKADSHFLNIFYLVDFSIFKFCVCVVWCVYFCVVCYFCGCGDGGVGFLLVVWFGGVLDFVFCGFFLGSFDVLLLLLLF